MKTNFYEFILGNLANREDINIITNNENVIRLINSIFQKVIYVNNKLQSIDGSTVYEISKKGSNCLAVRDGKSLCVNFLICDKHIITVMKQINKDLIYQAFKFDPNGNGSDSVETLVYTDIVDVLDKYNINYEKEELEKIGITPDICLDEIKIINNRVDDVLSALINESRQQLSQCGYEFDIDSLYYDISKKDEKTMVKKQNQTQTQVIRSYV